MSSSPAEEPARLLLTSRVLTLLGFSPYWGGSGDWGERRFTVRDAADKALVRIELWEYDERDDDTDGHWTGGVYVDPHLRIREIQVPEASTDPKYPNGKWVSLPGRDLWEWERVDFLHELLTQVRHPLVPEVLYSSLVSAARQHLMHQAIPAD